MSLHDVGDAATSRPVIRTIGEVDALQDKTLQQHQPGKIVLTTSIASSAVNFDDGDISFFNVNTTSAASNGDLIAFVEWAIYKGTSADPDTSIFPFNRDALAASVWDEFEIRGPFPALMAYEVIGGVGSVPTSSYSGTDSDTITMMVKNTSGSNQDIYVEARSRAIVNRGI